MVKWSIAPLIHNFGARWGRVVGFMSRPLSHRGKSPRYRLNRSEPRRWSGHFGEENKMPLQQLRPPLKHRIQRNIDNAPPPPKWKVVDSRRSSGQENSCISRDPNDRVYNSQPTKHTLRKMNPITIHPTAAVSISFSNQCLDVRSNLFLQVF